MITIKSKGEQLSLNTMILFNASKMLPITFSVAGEEVSIRRENGKYVKSIKGMPFECPYHSLEHLLDGIMECYWEKDELEMILKMSEEEYAEYEKEKEKEIEEMMKEYRK